VSILLKKLNGVEIYKNALHRAQIFLLMQKWKQHTHPSTAEETNCGLSK
jgi:hypothetical protein